MKQEHHRKKLKVRICASLLAAVLAVAPASSVFADESGTAGKVNWNYTETNSAVTISGAGAIPSYAYASEPWANLTVSDSPVQKMVVLLRSEVGYLEKASAKNLESKTANAGKKNYTKYGRDMHSWIGAPYYDGYAWCDTFADWTLVSTVGVNKAKALLGGWSAYTPTSANYYKKMGQWFTSDPKPGDQIFFRNDTRINHTGWVYKVTNDRVYTIEGNTISEPDAPENEGAVNYKDYDRSAWKIAGYGRPRYENTETTKLVKTITIGKGITEIGAYAFSGLPSLVSVTIPDGVTTIGKGAFQDDTSLKEVTIPRSVKTIGENAFANCKAAVTFKGSKPEWKSVTKGNGNSILSEDAVKFAIADPTSKPMTTPTPTPKATATPKPTATPTPVPANTSAGKYLPGTYLLEGNMKVRTGPGTAYGYLGTVFEGDTVVVKDVKNEKWGHITFNG